MQASHNASHNKTFYSEVQKNLYVVYEDSDDECILRHETKKQCSEVTKILSFINIVLIRVF